MPASPETLFDTKYRIQSRLASGGMGDVYLAAVRGPEGVERPVAVKLIRDDLLRNQSVVEMFTEEAKVAFLLTHPNIVQTFEVGQIDGHLFLVMEYVDGISLERLLRLSLGQLGQPLPVSFALYIAAQAARGLAYAHEHRDRHGEPLEIVHRDVSPSNVLLSKGGQVKLMDFGLVKSILSKSESLTGTIKGKLAYMAPEQLRGEKADARADIYALGITLYEMLAGKNPFGPAQAMTLEQRLSGQGVVPLSEVASHVEPPIPALVSRCVASDPADRVSTARELGQQIDGCVRELGLGVSDYDLADFIARAQEVAKAQGLDNGAGQDHPFDRALGMELKKVAGQGGVGTFVAVAGDAAAAATTRSLPEQARAASTVLRPPPALGRWGIAGALLLLSGAIGWLLLGSVAQRADRDAADSRASEHELARASAPASPRQASTATTAATDGAVGLDAGQDALAVRQPDARSPRAKAARRPRRVPRRGTGAARGPATAEAFGTLSVNSDPWSLVYIDGKRVRSTPLVLYRLSAGRHALELVNPARNLRANRTVTIRAGRDTRLSIELR